MWVRSVRGYGYGFVLVVVLTFAIGLPGAAQQAPPTFELPPVEVPGKRPQLPSTTPASISVITADEIAILGALSVADALRVLPELRVKTSGGPGGISTVSIRGSTSGQVLILLDGVPINRPDQASVDLTTFPIQNVERIEVLRGPFSAIYGSAALGGVINIVTRAAPQTLLSTRIGSYGLSGNLLSIGGQTGTLAYLVQGILNSSGAFAPDTDFSDFTTMAKLRWETGEDAAATLTFNRLSHATGSPGPLPFQDLLARLWEGRTLVDLSWRSGRADGPGAFVRLYLLDDDVNFTSPAFSVQSQDTAQVWGVQAQVVTAPWSGHLLTIGAEYQGQTIAHVDIVNATKSFNNQGYDLAVYLQDDWQIGTGLLLSLGVREDTFQAYGTQVNPRVGIVAVLSDRLTVRAGAGRTFRAPTFDELAPAFFGNPALQPESAWSYDLGFEYALAPSLAVHLTGYYTDATNLITGFPPINVGHAIVNGASIELVGRLAEQWFVRANFTDQLARNVSTGRDVVYIPRQQASLEVSYQWAPGSAVTLIVSFVGDRFNDPKNEQPVPGYWLTGLNATWALGGGFSIQAGIDNLFDISYQSTLGFPEPGRTAYVGVTKKF